MWMKKVESNKKEWMKNASYWGYVWLHNHNQWCSVCKCQKKTISLFVSLSFFSSHDSLRRSSHHVRGRVRCACYTFLQFIYQCYLLVMLCNCTELLTLHQNQAFEFLSARSRSICSCQFAFSISRFLVQLLVLFYHKLDDVKHDWMNESNDLILLTCACD